jgi:hypothetical protein
MEGKGKGIFFITASAKKLLTLCGFVITNYGEVSIVLSYPSSYVRFLYHSLTHGNMERGIYLSRHRIRQPKLLKRPLQPPQYMEIIF